MTVKVERMGWTFTPGDKVMQVVNDYDKEVFNGDLGRVRTIDLEAGELVAEFDGREVPMTSASWTSWCWPTPPRCTRRKARSTRRW